MNNRMNKKMTTRTIIQVCPPVMVSTSDDAQGIPAISSGTETISTTMEMSTAVMAQYRTHVMMAPRRPNSFLQFEKDDSFLGGSLMDAPHELQNFASNEFRPLHFGHSIGGILPSCRPTKQTQTLNSRCMSVS